MQKWLFWLWCLAYNKVGTTRISLNHEDGELQTYHTSCQSQRIIGGSVAKMAETFAAGDNNGVLSQLSSSMAQQTEEAAESNRVPREEIGLARERAEAKKNKLSDSLPDGDVTPMEAPKSCKEFYSKETKGLADQDLSLKLRAAGRLCPRICTNSPHRKFPMDHTRYN